ncbi:hypothetical protein BKA69DRAFT_1046722 [Paraphysoderma sedebokerense]|nr:hypothetical protein BKA69DRAFT_1046722 [Paraphysoderma sedebokerense]
MTTVHGTVSLVLKLNKKKRCNLARIHRNEKVLCESELSRELSDSCTFSSKLIEPTFEAKAIVDPLAGNTFLLTNDNSISTSSALTNLFDLAKSSGSSSCEEILVETKPSFEYILPRLAACAAELSLIEVKDNPCAHEKSNEAICLPPIDPGFSQSDSYLVLRKTVFTQFIFEWLNFAFVDAQLIGQSYKNPRYLDPIYMPVCKASFSGITRELIRPGSVLL